MSSVCSGRWSPVAAVCCVATALTVATLGTLPALAQSSSSDRQKERLKERDRYAAESRRLASEEKLPEAIQAAEKKLVLERQIFGDIHDDVADSLGFLAGLREQQEDFAVARKLRQEAVAIRTKLHGAEHWRTREAQWAVTTLDRLAQLGEEPRRQLYTASRLNRQVEQLGGAGRYDEALPLAQQAVKIRGELLGAKHPDYAISLENLGRIYRAKRDYAHAEPLFRQVLDIRKKALGELHPETANSLQWLGLLLHAESKPAKARPYLEQALAIRKRVLGSQHAETARSYYDLGVVLQALKDYEPAKVSYLEALTLCRKIFGDHPHTAWTLSALGNLSFQQKDYEVARDYHQQALTIRKKVLGDLHPDTAQSMHSVGKDYFFLADNKAARPYFEQALLSSQRFAILAAKNQSERELLNLSQVLTSRLGDCLSLDSQDERLSVAAYEPYLAIKGMVYARQLRLRSGQDDPELAPHFEELHSVTSHFAAACLSYNEAVRTGISTKEGTELYTRLDRLANRRELQEHELIQKVPGLHQEEKAVTLERILKCLPDDSVLVDFFVYEHRRLHDGEVSTEKRLNAFVLRPGAGIRRLNFGRIDPIELTINKWQMSTMHKWLAKQDAGLDLRRLLWEPLEPHLGGAKLVLISPDHAVTRVSFAALPGKKEGSFLLEDYSFAVVPVPRLLPDLLAAKAAGNKGEKPSMLLVGDVDYNGAPGRGGNDAMNGDLSGIGEVKRRKKWGPLTGGRAEVEAIAKLRRETFGKDSVVVSRGSEATESALRRERNHRWLHFATHGDFAPAPPKAATETGWDLDFFVKYGMHHLHPGVQSGLVLVGANRPFKAGQDDGIMTPLEVADLDLRKAELAVLSACETGIGRIAGGEGLMGLQRAFQIAGARSVVASMWSVHDEATRVLMERFYVNLWNKKMTKLEALREAQLWMLHSGRALGSVRRGMVREAPEDEEKSGPVPPFYWAAFVLSGDWR